MSGAANLPPPGSPEDWIRHAQSDLHFARIGSSDPDVLPNQVAFHTQQAVEKAIKVVLLHKQVSVARTHDLNALIQLLARAGIDWPSSLEQAKDLTPYAVQTRYPGYVVQLTKKEVTEAITMAEAVLDWANASLGLT
jgi:HEPN domain-containing protein